MPGMEKRKRIIVQRKIQFRFAGFVILFVVGTAFVTSVTVFWTTFSLLGERLAQVYPQGRLVEVFRTVYLSFFAILLLASVVIFYLSIRFSHRIVGPLPKIYDFIRGIGQGEFERRISLRRSDELHELADALNEMAGELERLKSRKS